MLLSNVRHLVSRTFRAVFMIQKDRRQGSGDFSGDERREEELQQSFFFGWKPRDRAAAIFIISWAVGAAVVAIFLYIITIPVIVRILERSVSW